MKIYITILLMSFTLNLNAQFSILNISPSNGSTNLSQSEIISVEFSQPLDTAKGFEFFQEYFTNAFSQDSMWYSSDLKTVFIKVNLESEKNYYFLVYSASSQNEDKLSNPTVVYFTTAVALTGRIVSGIVSSSENSGLDFSKTLVALSTTPIGDGEPMIEIGTFANSEGEYAIPFVDDGDYYPLAANDANADGKLDPSGGDAFSFLDLITITGDYSGLNFFLDIPEPLSLLQAKVIADSLISELFIENTYLKRITSWDTDSLGNAREWEFHFITDTVNKVSKIRIDRFGHRLENQYDEWEYQSLVKMDFLPVLENSVDLETLMVNAETAGGADFRKQDKPSNFEFNLEIQLADQRYSYFAYQNPDTAKHVMWVVSYRWYQNTSEDNWEMESELTFFGDFETGSLVITGVKDQNYVLLNDYDLGQNYPNPFNPNTSISYKIPKKGEVTLTVYDILGNKMKTLVDEVKPEGIYNIHFDAGKFPSGTYFYQLKANNYINTKKMLLLK